MRFEFNQEIARVIGENEEVIAEASSELVARQYFTRGRARIGLLPAAVRWISNDRLSIILERPPGFVTTNTKDKTFSIPLPWVVWGIRFRKSLLVEKSYLFARNQPIFSEEDILYALPLPNMSENSEVALPSNTNQDLGKNAARAIAAFWERPKNNAHSEILQIDDMLPAGWDQYTESVEKFLQFLTTLTLEEMNFTEFRQAEVATVADLIAKLNGPALEQDKKSVTQIFADITTEIATEIEPQPEVAEG